jgi:pimeloyl-ACP methyl ester carboxylesterase
VGYYDNHEFQFDSTALPCRVEGSGNSLLLLLHGLNGHSGTWRHNVAYLSSQRKVVAPSLKPWSVATVLEIEGYTNQVSALVEQLAPSTLSVAGNSMGGWIAMKLVGRFQHQISALVLEDTAGTRKPLDESAIAAVNASRIPVMIIWGRRDPIIPVADAEFLRSRIDMSEVKVLDAGHVPHWQRPAEFNEIVGDFLSRNNS